MRQLLIGFLVLAIGSGSAKADFMVKAAPPLPLAAAEMSPRDPPPNADGTSVVAPVARFKVAFGFGSHVPLSFACRQIVPRAVRVTYGPGAHPEAIVDWKGGDHWNRVLQAAVKPLGLRLIVSANAVEIRR